MNLRRWRFIEWLTFLQVLWLGMTRRNTIQAADIIQIHIAYPLLRHWSKLQWLYRKPLVVTEHWSAYHYRFHIEDEHKLQPMRALFRHADLLICVSEALKDDISKFSSGSLPKTAIVPNVVDTEVFRFREQPIEPLHFFMLSQWKDPKDPFTVIRIFQQLLSTHPDATLIIGGYGPQEVAIRDLIAELHLQQTVQMAGRMEPEQIADEMNKATAFIHLSEYETFSVVCAEALCSGCPVIASGVGGITSYLRDGVDGLLLNSGDSAELEAAMQKFTTRQLSLNRQAISEHAQQQFSAETVGRHYSELLHHIAQQS